MRSRKVVSGGLLLLAAIAGYAPQAASQNGQYMKMLPATGNLWQAFGEFENQKSLKQIYLKGLFDGLILADSTQVADIKRDIPADLLVDGVDAFYGDYRNHQIAVIQALRIVSLEIVGAPAGEIERRLRQMRKDADEIASEVAEYSRQ